MSSEKFIILTRIFRFDIDYAGKLLIEVLAIVTCLENGRLNLQCVERCLDFPAESYVDISSVDSNQTSLKRLFIVSSNLSMKFTLSSTFSHLTSSVYPSFTL